MFERAVAERPGDRRGQQVEGDDDAAAGRLDPVVDLLGDHERRQLQRGRAGQPDRLEGDEVIRNVRKQQPDAPAGLGTEADQRGRQPARLVVELGEGCGFAVQGAGDVVGVQPGGPQQQLREGDTRVRHRRGHVAGVVREPRLPPIGGPDGGRRFEIGGGGAHGRTLCPSGDRRQIRSGGLACVAECVVREAARRGGRWDALGSRHPILSHDPPLDKRPAGHFPPEYWGRRAGLPGCAGPSGAAHARSLRRCPGRRDHPQIPQISQMNTNAYQCFLVFNLRNLRNLRMISSSLIVFETGWWPAALAIPTLPP